MKKLVPSMVTVLLYIHRLLHHYKSIGWFVKKCPDFDDGGYGASRPDIQQRIRGMLGLFKRVAVPTKSILNKKQATLIAISLQHDSIIDGKPITSAEKTRLLIYLIVDNKLT